MLDLAEEHWSYMDRFAERLILRGPTVSEDGTEHTGSVHVVDVPDRASAERFATEEPYWRAGLYSEVTAVRTVVLLDRPSGASSLAPDAPHTLVTGQWGPKPGNADRPLPDSGPDSHLRFLAALLDDDQFHLTGVVGVVSGLPDEALKIVQPLADQLAGEAITLTARHWRRGGRR